MLFVYVAILIQFCFGKPDDKPIFQVPHAEYYYHLTYDDHYRLLDINAMFPMRNGYTDRHFWHQTSVVMLSLLNAPLTIRESFDDIINTIRKPYYDSMYTDYEIDLHMIDLLDTVLGDVLERPKDLAPSSHILQISGVHRFDQLYQHRIMSWGAKICLLDVISRNYLIMMHRYLLNRNTSLSHNLIYTTFRNIYDVLSNYERFEYCGNIEFYSNVLTRIDTMFNANFIRNGVRYNFYLW